MLDLCATVFKETADENRATHPPQRDCNEVQPHKYNYKYNCNYNCSACVAFKRLHNVPPPYSAFARVPSQSSFTRESEVGLPEKRLDLFK